MQTNRRQSTFRTASLLIGCVSFVSGPTLAQVAHVVPLVFQSGTTLTGIDQKVEDVRSEVSVLQEDIEIIKTMIAMSNGSKEHMDPAGALTAAQATTQALAQSQSSIAALNLSSDEKGQVQAAYEVLESCNEAAAVSAGAGEDETSPACTEQAFKKAASTVSGAIEAAYAKCPDQNKLANVLSEEDRKKAANQHGAKTDCAKGAEKAADDYNKYMDASRKLFAFAAYVCQQGNPYICGAFIVLAALAYLFGKGKGKGDGNDSKSGGRVGDGSPPGKPASIPGPRSPIFGAGGPVSCTKNSHQYTCRNSATETSFNFPASLAEQGGEWSILEARVDGTFKVNVGTTSLTDSPFHGGKTIQSITPCKLPPQQLIPGHTTNGAILVKPVQGTTYVLLWFDGSKRAFMTSQNQCP